MYRSKYDAIYLLPLRGLEFNFILFRSGFFGTEDEDGFCCLPNLNMLKNGLINGFIFIYA